MRNILKLVVLAAFVLTAGLVQAQDKLGFINSQAILAEMPEVKQADSELEALQKQLQKKGEQMMKDFQAEIQTLGKQQEEGKLSPVQAQEEEKRLTKKQQEIAAYEQTMVQQLQEKRATLLQPIIERVNKAIQEYGAENGYKMILDNGQVGVIVYAMEGTDITSLVKTKLGI